MPNLINSEFISRYLEGFCPENQEAADLLKLALAKPLTARSENLQEIRALPKDAPLWLKAKWPEGGPYLRFSPDSQLHDQVRHIADWIEVALQDKDHSLNRRDDSGKPFAFVGSGLRSISFHREWDGSFPARDALAKSRHLEDSTLLVSCRFCSSVTFSI